MQKEKEQYKSKRKQYTADDIKFENDDGEIIEKIWYSTAYMAKLFFKERGDAFYPLMSQEYKEQFYLSIVNKTKVQEIAKSIVAKHLLGNYTADMEDVLQDAKLAFYKVVCDDYKMAALDYYYREIKRKPMNFTKYYYAFVQWRTNAYLYRRMREKKYFIDEGLTEKNEHIFLAGRHEPDLPIEMNLSLREHLEQLNPIQRKVIIEKYYNNKLLRCIASELKIPENTIKSHLRRGKRKLRKLIENKTN